MELTIDNVNWPKEFPYRPRTRVEVTNDHTSLYLHYYVEGEQLRAVTDRDGGPESCPGMPYSVSVHENTAPSSPALLSNTLNEIVSPGYDT